MNTLLAWRRWLPLITILGLAGCQAPALRQWLDSGTAATISAQRQTLVLAREDFPAGVNVRDYAELGLMDVNRSGDHRQYVSLVLWSTVDRSADVLAAQEALFASITLWVNDQPVTLKRLGAGEQSVLISQPAYRLPSPNARDFYYALSPKQFQTMATAQQIALSPGLVRPGDQPYRLWRGNVGDLQQFVLATSH